MTREEEIRNEAKLKCHDIAGEVDYKSSAAYDGFVMGAEWADKTMIDKACEWLNKGGYFVNNKETINDFKRAMRSE